MDVALYLLQLHDVATLHFSLYNHCRRPSMKFRSYAHENKKESALVFGIAQVTHEVAIQLGE